MRKIKNIIIFGFLISGFLFTGSPAFGNPDENRIFDVNAVSTEQAAALSFEMSKKPSFSLKPVNSKGIIFSFVNVEEPDELRIKITSIPFLSPVTTNAEDSVSFMFSTQAAPGKIECAWIEKKSVFNINILFTADTEAEKVDSEKEISRIKDIRFGFRDSGTRMVLGTEGKPDWEIKYTGNNSLLLDVHASSNAVKTKTYYSDKWLSQVNLKNKGADTTEMNLNLQTAPEQIGIFWMNVGNRLVLDLFKEPDTKLTSLPEKYEENAEQKDENRFRNFVRMKIEEEPEADKKIKPVETKPGEQPEAADPILEAENNEANTSAPKTEITAEMGSELMGSLPNSIEENIDFDSLSAEEAFFYGRIKQARDIDDYSTGITLANEFLNKFSESPLRGTVSFWRGDFYFRQWEKGEKKLGQKVILAYKYATDRFGYSQNVQISYIKMAKVTSDMGDGYAALGYLLTVLTKKDPEYMPLAYLYRARIFLAMNQPDKAIKDLKILIDEYSKTPYAVAANLWIGVYYHELGLYDRAEAQFNKVLQTNPDLYLEHPEFILMSAKNYLYLEQYKKARALLFKAVNLGGQEESIDMLLARIGDTYHNENNDREAEKYYNMVINYYPESEGASISKLRIAEYHSDMSLLDKLIQDNTEDPISELAILEKAEQLYKNENYGEAIKTLKKITDKPLLTEIRKEAKGLFTHYIEKELERLKKQGAYRDLLNLYEDNRMNLSGRLNPDAYLIIAEAYKNTGRKMEAITAYNNIRPYDLSPEKAGTYIYGLGECYASFGETERAISFLEKNKNEKMDSQDKLNINLMLANLYMQKRKNKDASKLYQLVLKDIDKLPPKEGAEAYLNLGIALKAQKKYNEAKSAFTHSIGIALEKNTAQNVFQTAYTELGDVLYSEGEYKKAARAFEKGFSYGTDTEAPGYWDYRFRQAMTYLKTGEEDKAETLFNEVSDGGNEILQQRAQLKLGSIELARQMKILSMGVN